jgi:hypothetical protein
MKLWKSFRNVMNKKKPALAGPKSVSDSEHNRLMLHHQTVADSHHAQLDSNVIKNVNVTKSHNYSVRHQVARDTHLRALKYLKKDGANSASYKRTADHARGVSSGKLHPITLTPK